MTYYCQACGTPLTRAEADYHRGDCHAFLDQTRDDIAEEKRQRGPVRNCCTVGGCSDICFYDPANLPCLTEEPDEPHEQSSQDEHP